MASGISIWETCASRSNQNNGVACIDHELRVPGRTGFKWAAQQRLSSVIETSESLRPHLISAMSSSTPDLVPSNVDEERFYKRNDLHIYMDDKLFFGES